MRFEIINALVSFFEKEKSVKRVIAFGSLAVGGERFDEVSDLDLYIESTNSEIDKGYFDTILKMSVDILDSSDIDKRKHLLWSFQNNYIVLKGDYPDVRTKVTLKEFITLTIDRAPWVLESIRREGVSIDEFPSTTDPFFGYLVPYSRNTRSLKYVEKLLSLYGLLSLQNIYSPYTCSKISLIKDYLEYCSNDEFYEVVLDWYKILQQSRLIDLSDKTVFFKTIRMCRVLLSLEKKLFRLYKNC
jgi:predicted nucleotidyltransferase